MKICMFLDNPISRDPRVKGEARALAQYGHDVIVFGTRGGGDEEFEEWNGVHFERIDVAPTKGVKITTGIKALPAAFGGKASFVAKYKKLLDMRMHGLYVKRARGRGYDVFHANDLHMLPPAAASAVECGAKLVYDSHEYFRMDYFTKGKVLPPALDKYFSWLLARQSELIGKADLVITVCDNIANAIKNDNSLDKTPLVIYNTAQLRERGKKLNILREEYLHTSNDRPIVLYQGAISYGRGLEKLIGIARANPQADVVIIGPVSRQGLKDKLCELAEGLTNVYFLPPVPYEKLWQITLSADYGFSYLEPMNASYEMAAGNKLFEYLAAGLPIFTRGSLGTLEIYGKIKERISEENMPLCILPDEDEAQGEYVRGVLASDAAARSNAAYDVAENMFNQSIEHKKLIEAYEGLAVTK